MRTTPPPRDNPDAEARIVEHFAPGAPWLAGGTIMRYQQARLSTASRPAASLAMEFNQRWRDAGRCRRTVPDAFINSGLALAPYRDIRQVALVRK